MFSVIMEEESLNFRAILWASGRNTVKKKIKNLLLSSLCALCIMHLLPKNSGCGLCNLLLEYYNSECLLVLRHKHDKSLFLLAPRE